MKNNKLNVAGTGTYDPSPEESDTEGSLGLTGQPVQVNH